MKIQSLYDKLIEYKNSGIYPFHMPGHKRNLMEFANPFSFDITEIDGFDNLHNPEGILKEAMECAAKIYGSDKSYFLINGSTAGILSSICATTRRRGKILMARNCHKSVYHGVFLQELNPVYSYPQCIEEFELQGGLNVAEIEMLLINNPDIQMVFVTSPTYDGIVSDVKGIANCVHKYNIPLIVDEAHGAHFHYGEEFPVSALGLGADIVIQSLHKTLPSLTQTAILHIKGKYVDVSEIERYLSIYQSSSPSYVLLSSIIECIGFMEGQGSLYMNEFQERLCSIRTKSKKLKNIRLLDSHLIGKYDIFDIDQSKFVFSVLGTNMSGPELSDILLNKYHLQMEMSGPSHVLAMATLGDREEGLKALWNAVEEIDSSINSAYTSAFSIIDHRGIQQGMNLYEVAGFDKKAVALKDSIGSISGEFIYSYPPGIPILVPGEIISEKLVRGIMGYQKSGILLQGMKDHTLQTINVVKKG